MGQDPTLVKGNGERVQLTTTSTEDLVAMVAKLAAEVAQGTVTAVLNKVDKPEDRKGDWNVHNFPDRSVYNPRGEKDFPRADIVGDIWWNGQYLRKNDHTVEECILINQLRPGVFHHGQWIVTDLAPGVTGKRSLLVTFPCKDPDQRFSLPSMLDMLRELTSQTASAVA